MDQLLRPALPAITSLRQAAASERKMGALLRRLRRRHLQHDAAVAKLGQKLAQDLAPLEREIYERAESIEAFASHNRERLTRAERRKTVELPYKAGEIRWVMGPPALIVASAKEAIASIKNKRLGATRFLRVKTELNKEALLEAPEVARRVEGVRIGQHERFVIKPATADEKVEKSLENGHWSIVTPKKERHKE